MREVLEWCDSREELNECEKKWISEEKMIDGFDLDKDFVKYSYNEFDDIVHEIARECVERGADINKLDTNMFIRR